MRQPIVSTLRTPSKQDGGETLGCRSPVCEDRIMLDGPAAAAVPFREQVPWPIVYLFFSADRDSTRRKWVRPRDSRSTHPLPRQFSLVSPPEILPMRIATCPGCQTKLTIDERLNVNKYKCPKCQATLHL
jgi:hypothetical protein